MSVENTVNGSSNNVDQARFGVVFPSETMGVAMARHRRDFGRYPRVWRFLA